MPTTFRRLPLTTFPACLYLGQAKIKTNRITTVVSTDFHRTLEASRFDASVFENSSLKKVAGRFHKFWKQAQVEPRTLVVLKNQYFRKQTTIFKRNEGVNYKHDDPGDAGQDRDLPGKLNAGDDVPILRGLGDELARHPRTNRVSSLGAN